MMQKIKADVLVIGCVCIVAVMVFCILNMTNNSNAIVTVVREGELFGQYSLSEEKTILVTDETDGYNLVLISGGMVKVSDADCPDKLCVKQRAVSKNGESIICLPHKLVVQIISKEESDLDAVTN